MSHDAPQQREELPTRRQLVLAALALAAMPLIGACTRDTLVAPEPPLPTTPPVPDSTVIVRPREVDVLVTRIPALASVDSAVALLVAQLIVVRSGATEYVAFSNVCPHSGCGVSVVIAPRLVCPCHGSEFNFRGERLSGPAPTGLTLLSSRYDADAGILTVTRP